MDILNAITENEYAYFGYRCNNYRDEDCCKEFCISPREILSKAWAIEKANLFTLFGEQLILKRDIDIVADENYLAREIDANMEYGQPIGDFIQKLLCTKHFAEDIARMNGGKYDLYYAINSNFNSLTLAHNEITEHCRLASGVLPDGTKINFNKGAKVMRIYAKIAHAYGLDVEFEQARLEHSRILNTKRLTGRLCLSIHPLDFSTMSDNSNNWGSCMSWWDEGEYRQGTIEMMNSSCVIVAYLEDQHRNLIESSYTWNSKKWRELFIVDPKVITGIKGYPYQSVPLEHEVINWLRELAQTNWGIQYYDPIEYKMNSATPNGNAFTYYTNYMYNDFGSRNYARTHLFAEAMGYKQPHGMDYTDIEYSGPSQCMRCGELEACFEHEGCLNCEHCTLSHNYCCDCGSRLYNNEGNYLGDILYCPECYDCHMGHDIFTGEIYDADYQTDIHIVSDTISQEDIKNAIICNKLIAYKFPINGGNSANDTFYYFRDGGPTTGCINGTVEYCVIDWYYCYYIRYSQLTDEFFKLNWVKEHIGSRADLLNVLEQNEIKTRLSILGF